MSARNKVTDMMMQTMNGVHRAILFVSGGRLGWKIGGVQAVELHTIGRTSGQPRSTMLTAPVLEVTPAGTVYVLVASKGGDDRHPFWYLNLTANPDIELTVNGHTVPMRARTATDAEKARLWPRIVTAYRGYARYQKKTERGIPVVICEPRPV